jgi:hypothetical protein
LGFQKSELHFGNFDFQTATKNSLKTSNPLQDKKREETMMAGAGDVPGGGARGCARTAQPGVK